MASKINHQHEYSEDWTRTRTWVVTGFAFECDEPEPGCDWDVAAVGEVATCSAADPGTESVGGEFEDGLVFGVV